LFCIQESKPPAAMIRVASTETGGASGDGDRTMGYPSSALTVSPRLAALLAQIAETPDLETALWKVRSEYMDLKVQLLRQRIQAFESKWDMTFAEFAARGEQGRSGGIRIPTRSSVIFGNGNKLKHSYTVMRRYKLHGRESVCRGTSGCTRRYRAF